MNFSSTQYKSSLDNILTLWIFQIKQKIIIYFNNWLSTKESFRLFVLIYLYQNKLKHKAKQKKGIKLPDSNRYKSRFKLLLILLSAITCQIEIKKKRKKWVRVIPCNSNFDILEKKYEL